MIDKKTFTIKVLNDLKNHSNKITEAYRLGIDLIEFNNENEFEIDLIHSLAYILLNDNLDFNTCITDIEWFLYEQVDKIIYLEDNINQIDVSTCELYVDWLFDFYKIKYEYGS